jgi:hypothetical protein
MDPSATRLRILGPLIYSGDRDILEVALPVGIWLWALVHGPIQILKFSWPIHA